uniref:ABC transporter domain-containing protein n=1 Tax=Parastrongyloides trichosuri TaxID=131310 RepID=A0A0N4ZIX8_PARTI
MAENDDFYFDLNFLKALFHLLRHFFPCNDWKAFFIVLMTLSLGITNEIAVYYIGMLPGQFFYVLLKSKTEEFWRIIMTASLIYLGKSIIVALVSLSTSLLYLTFRKNITNAIHKRYFNEMTPFKLIHKITEKIDNPDQRITQDIERMCKNLAEKIIQPLLLCPLLMTYYSYRTYMTTGLYGCLVIYIYFIVGTIVNKLLINPLTKYTARVERAEGNYRYKHVSIRDNCEQIALYRGQKFERYEVDRIFNKLLKIQFIHCLWQLPNLVWKNFFDNTGGILAYALQFIPFFLLQSYSNFEPEFLAKVISNNAFIFLYLINCFTRLTDCAIIFGDTAGILQRVEELLVVCKNMKDNEYINIKQIEKNDDTAYVFKDVSLSTQYGQPVLKNFSFELKNDMNLLIKGVSGTGKTSFLRMLVGVWRNSYGDIYSRYNENDIAIIPQNSYLPSDNTAKFIPSNYIHEKPEFEFINHLTPGEVQRLVFIRAVIKNPRLLILDESTNAVGVAMEKKMYEILKSKGIQYISVGHRDSLEQYHDIALTLTGHGDFDLNVINKNSRDFFNM